MPRHTQSKYRNFNADVYEYDSGMKEFIPQTPKEWIYSILSAVGFTALILIVGYIEANYGIGILYN